MSSEKRIRPRRAARAAVAVMVTAGLAATAQLSVHTATSATAGQPTAADRSTTATRSAATTAATATHTAAEAGQPEARPGRVVQVKPLPAALWLPNTARAHQLLYTSTGFDGRSTVVSGTMFIPRGTAPKHGWPVLSWAHGTLGVADVCANSTAARSQRDIDYLTSWLAAGYAIVASDYQGLGTPGDHPYLHGRSEAYGVIDVVRAARKVDRTLSRTWMASGQSQGAQAALFTGAVEHRYAPELDYRGSIATAPPTQWRTTIAAAHAFDPNAPANPFGVVTFAGLLASHPATFQPGKYLTPYGVEVLQKARATDCYPAVAQQLAGQLSGAVYDVDAAEEEEIIQLLEQDADIPVVRHRQPMFIAQGTADTVVYPPATKTTADQLEAAGNDMTFKYYPGADHNSLMAAAKADLLAWAARQFARPC